MVESVQSNFAICKLGSVVGMPAWPLRDVRKKGMLLLGGGEADGGLAWAACGEDCHDEGRRTFN